MDATRLLIVSNRLPMTVSVDDQGTVRLEASSGGLATGLRTVHARTNGLWIGWPGEAGLSAREAEDLRLVLERDRLVPVELSADEVRRYYEGFSNRVIWPLFHYLLDHVPLDQHEWQSYEAVNRKFADAVLKHAEAQDSIWVHDYQLMLVPRMIREQLPDARIGFFLHVPFPTFEVFRLLPWRRRILGGLLGADLIGLHTPAYAAHCIDALEHLMHLDFAGDTADVLGRRVHVRAFPMGIDGEGFARQAGSQSRHAAARRPSQRGGSAASARRRRSTRLYERDTAAAAGIRTFARAQCRLAR
jgi:trehalose 6-phosphate synthase/phosphatase